MKGRLIVLAVLPLLIASPSLQAGPVPLVGNMYSSSYAYGFNAMTPTPQTSWGSNSTSNASQTLQNAAHTLNPGGVSAPGVSMGTPALTNPMPTAFYYNPYAFGFGYGMANVYGPQVQYQRVFHTEPPTSPTPASSVVTNNPYFSGGLTAGQILTDPYANPEPGTLLLFASGVVGLLAWRRRKA